MGMTRPPTSTGSFAKPFRSSPGVSFGGSILEIAQTTITSPRIQGISLFMQLLDVSQSLPGACQTAAASQSQSARRRYRAPASSGSGQPAKQSSDHCYQNPPDKR